MITIIASVLVFGLLIGIHEFGHLISAKLIGIKVYEFAIGMGVKLFSFEKGGTKYSLRLFPIGGFCNMNEDVESESEDAFGNKKPWQRILVLASGAIMNLILGFVILCILMGSPKEIVTNGVGEVLDYAPAYTQGLKSGDEIIKVNNTRTNLIDDIMLEMNYSDGSDIDVTVRRNGEKIKLKITPYKDEDGRYIIGYKPEIKLNSFGQTISNAFYYSIYISKAVLISLRDMIMGRIAMNQVSGPVGIVKEIGNAASLGFNRLLELIALITINLGLFNLLPFPALDGGRIVFVLYELITRKKVPVSFEAVIHFIGLLLLLLVMLFVTFGDLGFLK